MPMFRKVNPNPQGKNVGDCTVRAIAIAMRGNSGRRGRDSMGRYTSGRRYSRDEAKDEVMRHLEKAMNGASGEQRQVIQNAVEELKNL